MNKEKIIEEISKRNSPEVNDKLRDSHVVIFGAGGLGSNLATMLARVGVGRLTIIDFDEVEYSNLNRQYYFLTDIGKKKVYAIKEHIENINPSVKVDVINSDVTEENIEDIFSRIMDGSVICECFDKSDAKMMIFEKVMELNSSDENELKLVMGSGMAGVGNSNEMRVVKFGEDVYICGDQKTEAGIEHGVMAPRVVLCAALQANTALSILTGNNAI